MLIVLNNKSNLNKEEFLKYKEQLKKINTIHDLVLCPSNIYLPYIKEEDNIILGSQNVSSYKVGAHTGEVAASQLSSLDVKYSLVGHSERRKQQGESSKEINEKIKELLEEQIIPILCIGETYEEKERGITEEAIKEQIISALDNLSPTSKTKIIVAYEPIWAIGTGNVPSVEEIDMVLSTIKELLADNILLYGGSVTEDNIELLNNSKYINGYLLGGISLKPPNLQEFLTKVSSSN